VELDSLSCGSSREYPSGAVLITSICPQVWEEPCRARSKLQSVRVEHARCRSWGLLGCRCHWRPAHPQPPLGRYRVMRSLSVKRKSLTSAWRRSMSSTRKTPRPTYDLSDTAAAAAVTDTAAAAAVTVTAVAVTVTAVAAAAAAAAGGEAAAAASVLGLAASAGGEAAAAVPEAIGAGATAVGSGAPINVAQSPRQLLPEIKSCQRRLSKLIYVFSLTLSGYCC
jgi:hypothetical protein